MSLVLALFAGYLIGGIPTGILFCRVLRGVDPRTVGSGSMGATNVSRVLGKKWAIVVLLLDAAKGFLPVRFLAPALAPSEPALAGLLMTLGVVAGHIWTPYASFHGGKGVATAAGGLLALDPVSLLAALGVWLVCFAISHVVSLSSIIAAFAFPIMMLIMGGRPLEYLLLGAAIPLLIAYTHRANIRRLVCREEKPLF